jgi:phenylacetic acid degradation operon negative regulatory protein
MQDLALVALVTAVQLHRASFVYTSVGTILDDAATLFDRLQGKRIQKSLKRALYDLTSHGYHRRWKITDQAYRRLRELTPVYQRDRPWDGSFFLVIFDIPENLKRSRDRLRNALGEAHCGMIQKSVWVGMEDPAPALHDVVSWNELEDFVLVSKIGRDGYLSEEKINSILQKAFKLDQLNLHYKAFLDDAASKKYQPTDLALRYLGILKRDPQLPFELLPDGWLGDRAFSAYRDTVVPKLPHRDESFFSALVALH